MELGGVDYLVNARDGLAYFYVLLRRASTRSAARGVAFSLERVQGVGARLCGLGHHSVGKLLKDAGFELAGERTGSPGATSRARRRTVGVTTNDRQLSTLAVDFTQLADDPLITPSRLAAARKTRSAGRSSSRVT
jgi:hypothetical protein